MTAVDTGRRPYKALYTAISRVCEQIPDFKGDRFLMMAVCVRESMGIQWFCKCDSLFKRNLGQVRAYHGVATTNEFLQALTVKGGVDAGKVPKFKYNHSWFLVNSKDERFQGVPISKVLLASCSYGFASKPAIHYLSGTENEEFFIFLNRLMWDGDMQLSLLANDLAVNGAFNGDDILPGVFKYVTACRPKSQLGYATQLVALRDELALLYGQQTLDLNEVNVKTQ